MKFQFESCLSTLRTMQNTDGTRLGMFKEELRDNNNLFRGCDITRQPLRGGADPEQQLQRVKDNFLHQLEANLMARFPNVPLLEAMQVNDKTLMNIPVILYNFFIVYN